MIDMTDTQARYYLTAVFCRAGMSMDEIERILAKLPGPLSAYVRALESEARKLNEHRGVTIH